MDEKQAAQWGRSRTQGRWRYVVLRSLKLGATGAWAVASAVFAFGLTEAYGRIPRAHVLDAVALAFAVAALAGAVRGWAVWNAREREYRDIHHRAGRRGTAKEI